jgi:hypothetical protein
MELVYDFFDGRGAVEGHQGIHGQKKGPRGFNSMYGGINENMIECFIQRTGLNSEDTFTDVGSGIGKAMGGVYYIYYYYYYYYY